MLKLLATMAAGLATVQARVDNTPFEALMTKVYAPTKTCVKNGQCYTGSDPTTDCCSGHAVDDVECLEVAVCATCRAVVPGIVSLLATSTCAAIIPTGVTICEIAGLGPEDPLADVCAAIVAAGCPAIALLLSQGVTNVVDICGDIGFCESGQNPGTGYGKKCGCVDKGHCTYHENGCCSGKSSWSTHCLPPLSKCE